MKSWWKAAAAAILAIADCQVAWAIADIEGEVRILNGPNVMAGASGVIELRLHNQGPDPAPSPRMAAAWSPTPGHRTFEIFPIPETAPCGVRYTDFFVPPPDVSTIVANVFSLADLPPGSTLVCRVGIIVYDDTGSEVTARIGFGSSTPDPDESNNLVLVTLSTAPRTIPAGDWRGAIALVVLMIGCLALGRFLPNPS